MMDCDGPFGWNLCASHEQFLLILKKKGQIESMSFTDLGRGGSHAIESWKLCKEAKDRLEFLKLDDFDELYSLRLTGTQRIWCIREGGTNVMRVLWWDPDHRVCPSTLRNS